MREPRGRNKPDTASHFILRFDRAPGIAACKGGRCVGKLPFSTLRDASFLSRNDHTGLFATALYTFSHQEIYSRSVCLFLLRKRCAMCLLALGYLCFGGQGRCWWRSPSVVFDQARDAGLHSTNLHDFKTVLLEGAFHPSDHFINFFSHSDTKKSPG